MTSLSSVELDLLKDRISGWAADIGFDGIGVSDTDLSSQESRLNSWIKKGWHGEMEYMANNLDKRLNPQTLHSNTLRIINVRLNYKSESIKTSEETLNNSAAAYISRYALGRDYHKLMRKKLQSLANKISDQIGPFKYRAFVDSAPVMEKPLAAAAGLGWVGKHTNLINPQLGSWFFLGELYTDLPLAIDHPSPNHCGTCDKCQHACPTGALDEAYTLDARKCISYLTIEHKTSIPEEIRPLIGNRIFGCDDCQLVCPHNRQSPMGSEDFRAKHGLDNILLETAFLWTEKEFQTKTLGSPIRRLGYERWLRNIAVALGNGIPKESIILALRSRLNTVSPMVDEHINWALERLENCNEVKKAS